MTGPANAPDGRPAARRRPWIGTRAARVLGRLLTDEAYRNAALVRLERPANLFQPDNHTAEDRYPERFALAARLTAAGDEIRILSFGCSTGEEVFALRRYIPDAWIKGVDINRHNIAVCRRRLARMTDPRLSFEVAGAASAGVAGLYDAIFCMAVFRHGSLGDEVFERCDHRIRFEDFERTVAGLARALKPAGLLIIEHSNFRFEDAAVASGFEVVHSEPQIANSRPDPVYGPDNRLVSIPGPRAVAFRKRAASSSGAMPA